MCYISVYIRQAKTPAFVCVRTSVHVACTGDRRDYDEPLTSFTAVVAIIIIVIKW